MAIFAITALLLGSHVIVARARASYLSHFKFYLGVGALEGIPLLASAALLSVQLNYSLILFLVAIAFYWWGGPSLRRRWERQSRQNYPILWQEWDSRRAQASAWERLFFLLYW